MNKWKLTITQWKNHQQYKDTIKYFKTLNDVWNYLGFKLKRQRCGYSGMFGNTEYVLLRVM